MRAVVVGAGLAGLAAADALRRGGVEVVVLEARDRVGGRVLSRELPNGAVVELGAEFILPGNSVLTGLVGRFRLGLWDKGMRYGEREPRGVAVDADRLAAAAGAVEAAVSGLDEAARVSAADLLDGLDLDPGAREAMRARVEISAANVAERVDARTLTGIAAHADDPSPSIAGGNQRLATALAAELGEAVHLSSPVERILWKPGGVRLAAAGDEVSADACVLAVPAGVIGKIRFEPVLPEPVAGSLARVVYGQAAKLFVPLDVVPPPSAVLSVPGRYWTWTATGGEGVQLVVSAFAGSMPALAALRVESGAGTWLESIAGLRPDLALRPEEAVLATWHDDPWVEAAYSTRTPADPVDASAWAPVSPLHFCGEHTAGEYAALMEGALRSGLRAADEVVDGTRSMLRSG